MAKNISKEPSAIQYNTKKCWARAPALHLHHKAQRSALLLSVRGPWKMSNSDPAWDPTGWELGSCAPCDRELISIPQFPAPEIELTPLCRKHDKNSLFQDLFRCLIRCVTNGSCNSSLSTNEDKLGLEKSPLYTRCNFYHLHMESASRLAI